MNKQRHQALGALMDRLNTTLALLGENGAALADIVNELETLRDEEQEYYDNMPDGLRDGNKGSTAEAAVSSIESALDTLQDLVSTLEAADADDINSHIDDARGA